MSKISKIAVPGVAEPYDIEAYKALSIPFGQVDSTSTDTAYTAQIEGITSLYDGVCVYLKNGVITSNKNGFTLNINGLGAKPVYGTLAAATKSGTVFNVNYTMLFVYNSSRVSGGCWDIFYGYNSDTNTLAYNVRVGATPPTTSNKLVKYGIAFTKTDGHLLSSNTTGTTVTSKALTAIEFDPFAPMYYYPTTAVAANGTPSATYLYQQYSSVDLRYAFNAGSTLVVGSPVYARCVPQTDGTVKLDGNNCIVQVLPVADDNKVYIYLGYAYSTYQIFLDLNHPIYCIRDGRRELWYGDKHYWTDIINPPSTYTPSSHTHDYAPIGHTHVLDDIVDAEDKQDKMFIGQIDNAEANNYVTASDILSAFNQNKDICITYTDSAFGVLKFTSWNTAGNGTVVAANAIIQANGHLYVYDLHAYTANNSWTHEAYALAPESHDHSWSEIIGPPDFAPIDSPAFTGIPVAPTPTVDNDSTQIANTGWVRDRIDGLGTVFNLKGTKTNAISLPTINNTIGDVWYVVAESVGYIWLKDEGNTERWEKFGEPISLPATYTPSIHTHAWSEITSTPASYTPSAHTHDYAASSHSHTWLAITNPPSSYTPSAHNHAWNEITNAPATYTPSTHTHSDLAPINSPQFTGTPTAPSPNSDNNSTAIANTAWVNAAISSALAATDFITAEDLPATYTPSSHTHAWANISNPPASYTPSSHSHSWSEITNQPTIPVYTAGDGITISASNVISSSYWEEGSEGLVPWGDIDLDGQEISHTANISFDQGGDAMRIENLATLPTPISWSPTSIGNMSLLKFSEEDNHYAIDFNSAWHKLAYTDDLITKITLTAATENDTTTWTMSPDYDTIDWTAITNGEKLLIASHDNSLYVWTGGIHRERINTLSNRTYLDLIRISNPSSSGIAITSAGLIPSSILSISKRDADWDSHSATTYCDLRTTNLLTEGWHDQYTVQDTTLIIGDVPVEENNVSPMPEPDGER